MKKENVVWSQDKKNWLHSGIGFCHSKRTASDHASNYLAPICITWRTRNALIVIFNFLGQSWFPVVFLPIPILADLDPSRTTIHCLHNCKISLTEFSIHVHNKTMISIVFYDCTQLKWLSSKSHELVPERAFHINNVQWQWEQYCLVWACLCATLTFY